MSATITGTEVLRPLLIIDGKEMAAADGATFETVSPATNELLGIVPKAGDADAVAAIEAAHRAFESGPWGRFTPLERSRALHRMAQILRDRIDEISRLETMNSG
jgi:acyl-CoA reductase-like NAD-dependent aldehyde dehydrogenase